MGRRSILILTGEPSGDRAAGALAAELFRAEPSLRILAVGGPALREAGAHLLEDIAHLGAMGFAEVVRQLPTLHRLERRLRRLFDDEPPSAFVPVDYPGFNLRIARLAKARGIPVVYYIGPQVWAWGAARVPRIARLVDRMLVVFPFEVDLYRSAGVRVDFVGHPLLDALAAVPRREAARARLGLAREDRVLALLPGSRAQEIRQVFPVMVEAAARVRAALPGLRVVASVAPSVPPAEYARPLDSAGAGEVELSAEPAATIGRAADVALVTSGTATLETALLGTPLAVLYRASPLTWFVGRRIVRLRRISLVNIVAGEDLVAEFLQGDARPERVAEHAVRLLGDGEARAHLAERLRGLGARLGSEGAARRAAAHVLEEARA